MSSVSTEKRPGSGQRWGASLSALFGGQKSTNGTTATESAVATTEEPTVAQIGATAGRIWGYLAENGPTELGQLARGLDMSRDVVVLAVGWLAREEKVNFESDSRSHVVSLR